MTREPVLLVAGGGLARETLAAIRAGADLEPIGVLDDNPATHGTLIGGVEVLGCVDGATEHPGVRMVVCAGQGRSRRTIVGRLNALGASRERFATVVHPAAVLADDTVVGAGSIVLAGVVATSDVKIGEHVVAMPRAVFTHDVRIADYATICAGVALAGSVEVGEAAYLGTNASVRQGLAIGAEATLGMGAALISDLPPGQVWVGVPARPWKHRTPENRTGEIRGEES